MTVCFLQFLWNGNVRTGWTLVYFFQHISPVLASWSFLRSLFLQVTTTKEAPGMGVRVELPASSPSIRSSTRVVESVASEAVLLENLARNGEKRCSAAQSRRCVRVAQSFSLWCVASCCADRVEVVLRSQNGARFKATHPTRRRSCD